jgi:hypothetical protein
VRQFQDTAAARFLGGNGQPCRPDGEQPGRSGRATAGRG